MNISSSLRNPSLLAIIMMVAWLITGIGLPLSIFIEFRESNRWLFYFQLYPHLILFSLLFFGIVLLTLYQAIRLVRNRISLIRNIAVILCLSFLLLYIELTSNNMMLFEFKNTAKLTINGSRETIENIRRIPISIIDTNKIITGDKITINKLEIEQALNNFIQQKEQLEEDEKLGYYELMKLSLSYQTWKDKNQFFSYSRWLYASAFFIITSATLINGMLFFVYSRQDVRNHNKYIYKLAAASLLFTTWIPLRFYYNLITKNLLFGSKTAIGNSDIFAFIIYPIFLTFIVFKIYQIRQDWLTMTLIITIVSILTLVGRFKPEWINFTFGLNSNPITWIIWLLPSLFILYFLSQRQMEVQER